MRKEAWIWYGGYLLVRNGGGGIIYELPGRSKCWTIVITAYAVDGNAMGQGMKLEERKEKKWSV